MVFRLRDQPQRLGPPIWVRPDLDALAWSGCCGWSSTQLRPILSFSPRFQSRGVQQRQVISRLIWAAAAA